MKHAMKKSALSLAITATLFGTAGWSGDSQACATEAYLSSLCLMSVNWTSMDGGFMPANGQILQVNQNMALYSLIGNIYGGSASATFALPDLRGRVVVGAGQGTGLPNYQVGQKGGALTLTMDQIPSHAHALGALASATASIGTLVATTTLTGLSATTSMNGVTASAAGSGLTLNGSSGANMTNSPAGASLATQPNLTKLYATVAPTVAMQGGAISGSAPVSFSGNPTTTLSGTPTTSLSGAPSVTLGGTTQAAGAANPAAFMPPYLSLNYFISTSGIYPTRNN